MRIIMHSERHDRRPDCNVWDKVMYILCDWDELGNALNETLAFGHGEIIVTEVKDGYIVGNHLMKVEGKKGGDNRADGVSGLRSTEPECQD